MTPNFDVAWFALSLAALWAVWTVGVQGLVADHFRHQLYAIRRELFLVMMRTGVEPNDPSYVFFRTILNRSIVSAGQMSLLRLIFFVRSEPDTSRFATHLAYANEKLEVAPTEYVADYQVLQRRYASAISRYLLLRTPLTTTALLLVGYARARFHTKAELEEVVAKNVATELEIRGEELDRIVCAA